eukprot:CAMPEP_0184539654 /NCGR_PEP_ID=MMETSP0198_2-20121128/18244_1 /TAXON_ID=1112570 /ORGANISM="Thraustochytrium sp., Strain LLF1b" /LENGTH=216 /DNA_ID=CAMNT_0026933189 /DNA_START=788 /DNA_END=1438 /DNA_ORIENTATION=+
MASVNFDCWASTRRKRRGDRAELAACEQKLRVDVRELFRGKHTPEATRALLSQFAKSVDAILRPIRHSNLSVCCGALVESAPCCRGCGAPRYQCLIKSDQRDMGPLLDMVFLHAAFTVQIEKSFAEILTSRWLYDPFGYMKTPAKELWGQLDREREFWESAKEVQGWLARFKAAGFTTFQLLADEVALHGDRWFLEDWGMPRALAERIVSWVVTFS